MMLLKRLPMKRFRNLAVAGGVFCLLLFLFISFLNLFYLPRKAKAVVIRTLENQTGLKVELSRLSFHLLKGIALQELRLRDPQTQTLLFQARRVYVQHFWLSLILKKEFIASGITFEKPSFALTRFQDGRWNVEPFWQKTEQKKPALALIPRISVVQGEILLTDQTVTPAFSKRVVRLNGKAYVGLPAHLYFKGSFGFQSSPVSVLFTGSHPFNKEAWSLRCTAHTLSLSDLSPYVGNALPFLESAEGDLSFESRFEKKNLRAEKILFRGRTKWASQGIRGEASLDLTGRFSYEGDRPDAVDYALKSTFIDGTFKTGFLALPLKGARGEWDLKKDLFSLNALNATLGKTPVSLKGTLTHFQDPEIDFTLAAESDIQDVLENLPQKKLLSSLILEGPVDVLYQIKGKMNAPSFSGSVAAKDVSVKGLPSLGAVEHLRGSITLTENSLKTDGLTGQHEGFPFELKGSLSDFQNPLLDLELRLTQSLKSLEKSPLFQTLSQNFRPSLSGWGQWDLRIQGPLQSLSQKEISGSCHLQNASLKVAAFSSPVEKMDGEVSFAGEELHAKGITGMYAGNPFRFDGSIQKSQTPNVAFSLTTKTFQLSSRFTVQGKDLRPFALDRRTAKSRLSAEGEILSYEKPVVRLKGQWEGPIEELETLKILGEKSPLSDIHGILATQFALSGPKEHPDAVAVSGEFSSPLLTYKSFKFKGAESHYAYQDKTLTLSQFSGHLWGGHLLSDASVLFSGDKRYTLKVELREAKLAEVIQSVAPDQRLRGLLSITLQGGGRFDETASFSGEGWFKVEQGDLFEIPILGGMNPVLRPVIATVYPQLDEKITFQEAYAHYEVRDEAVHTENLILKGDRATLYGEGSVGFDRSVNFRIGVQFTDPQILERPTKLSQLKNIFISDTGMLSGEVRVSGTLSEPKYRYAPLSTDRIQHLFRKTGNAILERIFE